MERVKIGVIGCGYWGPNLIRNFTELQTSVTVAVSDLRQDRLDYIHAIYPQVILTRDYQELFQLGLDAVVIATPPPTHYPLAKECLEKGLHVLVEKPLALDSQQARHLCDLAAAKQRTLMVGHTFEFNSAVHALKKLIQNGDLGDIYYIDMARLNLGLFQRGLNVLWDLAPHDISILLFLLGQEPVSVSAHGTACVFKDTHDVAYINLLFPGDMLSHIHVSWIDPCKVRRVTVVGSKKMAVYNDVEMQDKLRIYDKGVNAPEYSATYGDFLLSYRQGDVVIPNIKLVEPLRQECQHFIECIQSGQSPRTSGEEGYKVVKILEAAQHSLMNNCHKETIAW